MSIKNKGFVLLETIIVMSVLLIGMILLYSNYNRIFMNSGKISYYDNVEDMYTAYYVYLNKDIINTSSNEVVDVSDNEVLKNLGIERIYFIDKDVFTNLYTKEVSNCENLDSLNCFDGSTIAYLKSIENKSDVDKCAENNDCLTIVKIKRGNHYYFAKYEAYNVKPTAFKPSTTTTTTTTTTTKPIVYSFANDSWATIANNVRNGLGYKYKVGDTKKVSIDGTNYTVRIANNSHYGDDCKDEKGNTLESETACGFVVEFVDIVDQRIEQRRMNGTNTNKGGWPATDMRKYLNGTFKSKLPSDLQSAIIDTTVVSGYGPDDSSNFTSTDKIYLLSTAEVWANGVIYDTAKASTITRQLDYYLKEALTSSNLTYAVKKFNGTAAWWWLRTADSNGYYNFLSVYSNGSWNSSTATDTSGGLAPAFRIG